jgi:hypothetical protein
MPFWYIGSMVWNSPSYSLSTLSCCGCRSAPRWKPRRTVPGCWGVLVAAFTAAAWGTPSAVVSLVAGVLLALSILMSLALLVPISRRARSWTAEEHPADWREQQQRWDRLHHVRVAIINHGLRARTGRDSGTLTAHYRAVGDRDLLSGSGLSTTVARGTGDLQRHVASRIRTGRFSRVAFFVSHSLSVNRH